MSEHEIKVPPKPIKPMDIVMIILGSAMYACAVNWFMMPLNLYAGGIVGLAQLIRTLLFSSVNNVDVAGIINLCLNVPLFLLAYRTMSKRMLLGTIVSVAVQTIVFTIVKIPAVPILDDKLAGIVIAGLLGGLGCGIILTYGGSAGGLDLLGVYLTQKGKFSVGLMNLLFNVCLYSVMAVLFSLSTAVYSIIFVAAFSLAIDHYHYQNIELELMIFTHQPEVKQKIMTKYVRGVTCWNGIGAYTNKGTEVLVTVVAKSEVEEVKRDILAIDPHAFIIEHDGVMVTGGYQKRLT
ncbi:MAG: YitT family protein [Bulleidia sp.]|nr:YitT family protein [Bulleidia sp.]